MDPAINGMNIAILVTDGFEQVEMTGTKEALEREGALTRIISNKPDTVQGVNGGSKGDQFTVDLTFDETDPAEFDAIVVPGGAENGKRIRDIEAAQRLLQGADEQGKPIGAICHGTLLLISAGLAEGRTLTSWPALQDEFRNAGANWIDQEVVVDGNLVTSRKPDDAAAFGQQLIESISERMQANLRGKAVGIASS
jgi:protease I